MTGRRAVHRALGPATVLAILIAGCSTTDVEQGLQYATGQGAVRDDARAVALFEKACDAG